MEKIERSIFSCCPFCGETYMFNKLSSREFYNDRRELEMVIATYYCDACHSPSSIVHDLVNYRAYGEY